MDNNLLIETTASALNIKKNQVSAVIKLLSEGATIPFIARYRKEMTGSLNEEQIKSIEEVYKYQESLYK